MTGLGGYLTRVELLRLRGSLDYARDDVTRSVVFSQGWTTFPGVSSGIICPLNDMLRFALNDRTSIEMTFFWGDRHFDQA